ncbi:VanZ family protein [Natronospora cellulosivora (SeqCode)]
MKFKKIFAWLAVILWMGLIFYLSSQAAEESRELSIGITQIIANFFETVFPFLEFDINSFHHFIRKAAHFSAYFVLGVLLINAFRISGISMLNCVLSAISLSVLYAVVDEVHQIYVPGRVGDIRDIMIDSVGAIFGISLYVLILKFKKSKS